MPGSPQVPQDAPIGFAYYPGVLSVLSATYTLLHGISPGVCSMQIAPQEADLIASVGDLVFSYGNITLTFRDCKLDSGSLHYDRSRAVVTLNIVDRRWKWAFGTLSGQYNQREWDGSILPIHEKRPQELAAICLTAAGETVFDVSQLPDDTRPAITWNAAVPMAALADLCDQLGCRVVLQLDGSVLVARPGVGADLPVDNATPVENFGQSVNPPERPDSLIVLCGQDRIQVDILLEPLVRDVDGSVKTLDAVSYKPAGGWLGVVPGVCSQITKGPARDNAIDTFCRWYGITAQNLDGSTPMDLPYYGPVYAWQQLRVQNEMVQKFVDDNDNGAVKPVPAFLYGSFTGVDFVPFANSPITYGDSPGTIWPLGFSLDTSIGASTSGIVTTNSYAYAINGDPAFPCPIPATLILRTSVRVVDLLTWAPSRYQRRLDFGTNFGTLPKYLLHEELEYQVLPNYAADGTISQWTDNQDLQQDGTPGVNPEADYYLSAANLLYQTPSPIEIGYPQLMAISPDGAIQQVTWTVGTQSGAHTRACRNNEFSTTFPSFSARRQVEQLRTGQIQQFRQASAAAALQGLVPGRNGL